MASAAAATRQSLEPSAAPHMKGAVIASVIFHLIVIILCIFGLPYFHHKTPELEEPMSVELVKQDQLTQTNLPPMHAPLRTPPQQTTKPPPPTPVQPPQMLSPTPPKPISPEKPVPPVKDTVPLPKKDELAPPKKVKPPKPPEKKAPPDPKKAAEEQAQFQSVLKNLMPSPPVAQAAPQPSPNVTKPSPMAAMSQQLTSDETDALRKQLSECWSLMAGARYAEDLVVDIHMIVNQDRTVASADIVDTSRYNVDSYFRAAADSAKRAIFNPHCTPLDLPPDKYESWKDITVTFDPKDML